MVINHLLNGMILQVRTPNATYLGFLEKYPFAAFQPHRGQEPVFAPQK